MHFLLNLGCECSSLTVTTQKANACSPWTPGVFLLRKFEEHLRTAVSELTLEESV